MHAIIRPFNSFPKHVIEDKKASCALQNMIQIAEKEFSEKGRDCLPDLYASFHNTFMQFTTTMNRSDRSDAIVAEVFSIVCSDIATALISNTMLDSGYKIGQDRLWRKHEGKIT